MASETQIFKTKYTSLSISQVANKLELRSGSEALQSVININRPHKLELKNLQYLMGILMFIPPPQNILLLGTGGGSLIHFLKFQYPHCQLVSVDQDAELQELMHDKMLLPRASKNLDYVNEDAEHFVFQCNQQFDLILVDIFSGYQSPDWLLHTSSIKQIHDLISDQGAVGYNLLIESKHASKLFYRNLARVFSQQTLYLPVEGYDNTLAYGFRHHPPQHEIFYHMNRASSMGESHDINYSELLTTIYTNNPIGSGII